MSRMCELRRTPWLYRRLHAELHASAIPDPRTRLQWTTRVALVLLHQTATQTSPCSARTVSIGERAAAGTRRRWPAPPPARPNPLNRPIQNPRLRLDRGPN